MKKANVADLRKSLELADTFHEAGILFMPMPVLSDADYQKLKKEVLERMEALAAREAGK